MSMISFPTKTLHRLHHRHTTLLNPRARTRTRTIHFASSVLTMAASWSCNRCTFLNPPSQKLNCQICLSQMPSPSQSSTSSPSSSVAQWSCKACTFLNPYNRSNCEVCDTRAPMSSLSAFEDLNDTGPDFAELGPSVGSVFFPLRPCKKSRLTDSDSLGFQSVLSASENSTVTHLEEVGSGSGLDTLKILSYNVWFREDLELQKRMKALGDLIELHSPEIICLQEVTPNIYSIFQQSNWWKVYNCSVSKQMAYSSAYFCMQLSKMPVKSFTTRPFRNSIMGRELCVAEIEIHKDKKPLTIATSHLESPCPAPPTWNQMYSKERVDQAKEAIDFLEKKQNAIFVGDMNWDDKLDGPFPSPCGWVDAWAELRPGEDGWTYDTKSNKMLTGNRTLQKRLDRFVCKLDDSFEISRIEMIGMDVIPGLSYVKEKKLKNEIKKLELPVLPSDHYGLLLTITRR